MDKVLGIDLGTTYSCVAYVDEYGRATVLKNRDGGHTTPSVVYFEENKVIVGNRAKKNVKLNPENTVQFIKRKMGKEESVMVSGKKYSAPQISAYILEKLVKDANDELRQMGVIDEEEIKDVVITCPAYFGMKERQATIDAGKIAGLNVLAIINEPTAAAISYGVSGKEKKETVLVYDLGGGTFDITVMEIDKNEVSVICSDGDDKLGGKDWDDALANYFIEQYSKEKKSNLENDLEALVELYIDVEEWKKDLTTSDKINVSIVSEGGRFRRELTRYNFEELTRTLLLRTKYIIDRVLETSKTKGFSLNKIDKVLLVGGSSRMPQVAKMIEEEFGVVPILQDPDEAVAKGAAIYAQTKKDYLKFIEEEAENKGVSAEELFEENLSTRALDTKFQKYYPSSKTIKVTDVLSKTYGTDVRAGVFNMLFINDELPACHTELFNTIEENQQFVSIAIYESNRNELIVAPEAANLIESFTLQLVKPVKKGTKIEVTFSIDSSMILHMSARELEFGSYLEGSVKLVGALSDKEIIENRKELSNARVE